MEGFAYGNARLRAMRSRLLSRDEITQMASAGSLGEFMNMLAKTPYRKSLEVALVHTGDLDSIFEALRRDFVATIGKISGYYEENEIRLIDLVLSAYDLHNLKTVLRGLSHNAARDEIERALLPAGETSDAVMAELLRASNAREAIDILATINHPYALPLIALRAEQPGAGLAEMEQALDRWHFHNVTHITKEEADGAELILADMRQAVDIANLLTVLRFVHSARERPAVKARLEGEDFDRLFPGTGALSKADLQRVYQSKNLKEAVGLLSESVYAQPLAEGLRAYEQSGRLSDIERALNRYRLNWQAWQIARDPLGIGVMIGFLALKTNEIDNIRRVARGIQLRLSPEISRAELEFAT